MWYNCCFPSEETSETWSRKPCPRASCRNISTCRKNLRETARPLGSRWRPHATFPWSSQGIYPGTPSDAIPLKLGCLGQRAVEECFIPALHLYLMPLTSQLRNCLQCVLQMRRGHQSVHQMFFNSLNRSLCGFGFSCLLATRISHLFIFQVGILTRTGAIFRTVTNVVFHFHCSITFRQNLQSPVLANISSLGCEKQDKYHKMSSHARPSFFCHSCSEQGCREYLPSYWGITYRMLT